MFVDSAVYGGKCECGQEHEMTTRFAVIEGGALKYVDKYLAMAGLSGKRCALYGENGWNATADRHPKAEQQIVLPSDGLHADEKSTAYVLSMLEEDVDCILAVGTGTIHDIARYCAYRRGIAFVSCPTGASVDGFCSSVTAMTWNGYKKTSPAVAPTIVVADIDIIKAAPSELVRSGVGDIIAKYTALADWEISHELTGEFYCPRIARITKEAVDKVVAGIDALLCGEPEAYENVVYSLILSGLAMQMMGNSRPASGAEHHISHTIEMGAEALSVKFATMHGEKVGVGTLLVAEEYKRIASALSGEISVKPYTPLEAGDISAFFGEKLTAGVMEENKIDSLSSVRPEELIRCRQRIREIAAQIPEPSEIEALLIKFGAKHSLREIGVSELLREPLLKYSPCVRNRLSLMRIKRMLY